MPLPVCFDSVPLGTNRDLKDWPNNGVLINSVVDFILDNVRSCPSLEQYKMVPVPDLVQRLEVHSMVAGTLTADRGTLCDLTTLHRAGNLTLSTEDGVLYVSGSVTLDTLHAVFRRYSLQVSVFRKTGNLLALEVGKNSFHVFLTIHLGKASCDVKLRQISVTEFSDVSVDLTGFSVLNSLSSKMAECVIHYFSGVVRDIVESYATRLVNGVFSDQQLVTRLLGYGLAGMTVAGRGEQQSADNCCQNQENSCVVKVRPCCLYRCTSTQT